MILSLHERLVQKNMKYYLFGCKVKSCAGKVGVGIEWGSCLTMDNFKYKQVIHKASMLEFCPDEG